MSGRGREALPNVREWSGRPRRFVRVIERSTRCFGSGRDALGVFREWLRGPPDFREWSERPPGCPGVVGMPSRMSECSRKTLVVLRE